MRKPKHFPKTNANNLNAYIVATDCSPRQFANKIGVAENTPSKWMREDSMPQWVDYLCKTLLASMKKEAHKRKGFVICGDARALEPVIRIAETLGVDTLELDL